MSYFVDEINLEKKTEEELDWLLKFIMGRPLSGRGLDEAKARGWKVITDKNGKQYLDDKDRSARQQERKDYKEKIKKARSAVGAQEKGRLGKSFKDQVWAKMKEMGGGNLREPQTRGKPGDPRLKRKAAPSGEETTEKKLKEGTGQEPATPENKASEAKEPTEVKEKKTRKSRTKLGKKKISKSAKAKALKEITNLFREKNKLGKSGKIPKEYLAGFKEFKRGFKTSEVQAKKQGKESIRKSREALGFKPTGNLKSYEKQILQGHSAGKITTEDAIAQLAKRRGDTPKSRPAKRIAKEKIDKELEGVENKSVEPKKRGRPKKIREEEKAAETPKKRGRPKKIREEDKEEISDKIAKKLKKELGEK